MLQYVPPIYLNLSHINRIGHAMQEEDINILPNVLGDENEEDQD